MIADVPCVPVTKALRETLRAEIRRTGVTALMLLANSADLPAGLKTGAVNRWIGGLVKQAPEAHVNYVLGKWASLPDDAGCIAEDGTPLPKRGKRFREQGERRIAVTEEMAVLLRSEFVRTGLDQRSLLDNAIDAPEGLNPRVIQAWLYREVKTANAAYWDWVAMQLRETTDRRRS